MVPTCVGKHKICGGNHEIILIGNRKIKRPRICHDFKTANFNSRKFKWGYSTVFILLSPKLYELYMNELSCKTFLGTNDFKK